MVFNKESDFEEALIKILSEKGWEKEVLKNYSEKDYDMNIKNKEVRQKWQIQNLMCRYGIKPI